MFVSCHHHVSCHNGKGRLTIHTLRNINCQPGNKQWVINNNSYLLCQQHGSLYRHLRNMCHQPPQEFQ